ncbi:MAG: acetyl-CoA hydrolase/transferase C-terminal domain-containing protein [Syntrophomonadaceae bacterium]|nr:acetyl-CoA hydrolase/transferase C-terminal domain-containing protein [Syntrophomonadaceae bacterium]
MNWQDIYQQKLRTADEAVKAVQSGDWLDYSFGLTNPNELDAALAKRKDELWDVKIRVDIGMWPHYTLEADPTGEHFYWHSWHMGATDRKWYEAGLLSYLPMTFHQCPKMTRENCVPARVVMISAAPMDKHGYLSFGAASAATWAAIEAAEVVIVEINERLPRVLGGNQESVHISRVDYVVESSNQELPTLPVAPPSAIDSEIAGHIIEHIYDGCCIQLGIGGIPNAIGAMIADSDLKDLGVHTEMYVDAYVRMTQAGRVTGARKNIDKYKQVFSFALGSRELYDFIDDNPGVVSYSVDYCNDPSIIALIDDFVSINACIEVDLFGQVCSETVGTRHISGTGGQLDFVEGAYRSKNGQSFICMTSTVKGKNGVASRINPTLPLGAIVTTPRTVTHKLVTEYGIADMKGKSTWERAEALIAIAHPDFRDQLIKDAAAMKIWRGSNKKA